MTKKVKPTAKKIAVVKKKKSKASPKKSAPLQLKRKTIFKTMPNPFASSYIVMDTSGIGADGIKFLKFNGAGTDILTSDVTKSDLFPTMEAAQIAINDAFIMAGAGQPASQLQIVASRTLLKPHYAFDFVDGQFMLSVTPKPVDDDAVSFTKARAEILKALKAAEREAIQRHKAFRKTWG